MNNKRTKIIRSFILASLCCLLGAGMSGCGEVPIAELKKIKTFNLMEVTIKYDIPKHESNPIGLIGDLFVTAAGGNVAAEKRFTDTEKAFVQERVDAVVSLFKKESGIKVLTPDLLAVNQKELQDLEKEVPPFHYVLSAFNYYDLKNEGNSFALAKILKEPFVKIAIRVENTSKVDMRGKYEVEFNKYVSLIFDISIFDEKGFLLFVKTYTSRAEYIDDNVISFEQIDSEKSLAKLFDSLGQDLKYELRSIYED
jgi:hypothetical protein